MHDRSAPPKSQPGAPPGLKQFGRDLRLDACRGIALWFVFLDHVPNNIGSWFTLGHYGFSDATEIFVFVSGVTCALAYGKAQKREGWSGAFAHTVLRSWKIYVAFLLLTIACAVMAYIATIYLANGGQFADDSNTRILLEHPGPTLTHAMILQYRPVNSDVLPTFVVFHILFAPLLFVLLRAPNLALGASLCLYALVRYFGWNIPAWPANEWYFNPFAWQVLFVFGAWWATGGNHRLWPLIQSRFVTWLAVTYVLIAFIIVLGWDIKPLGQLVPQAMSKWIYPIDKSGLDLLRLLHFLALALLAERLVPHDWSGFGSHPELRNSLDGQPGLPNQFGESHWASMRRTLVTPLMRGAIRCGENSLAIYCFGVVLALGGHMILVEIFSGLLMQIAISVVGIGIMIAVATGLTFLQMKHKQRPGLF